VTAGRRWSRGWAWTPDEDRILAAHYPAGGSTAAQAALEAAGFPPRTVNALNRRAFTLGLRTGRRTPAPVGPVEAWTAATHAVRSFRGLPATLDDVCDLTGMSRSRARRTLDLLVAGGVLASRVIEWNVTVWYDPAALAEEERRGSG